MIFYKNNIVFPGHCEFTSCTCEMCILRENDFDGEYVVLVTSCWI